MAEKTYSGFWNMRSIVSLIGIDYPILEKSGHDNLRKFYIAGFLVLGILLISFCAIFYAFDLMFDMWHAEILLSTFFSLMFLTIYIFLIQTFSKEIFPTPYKLKFFNLSNLSRIGFVLMIGLLIAQPIKIFVFRDRVRNDIIIYKDELYKKFSSVNSRLYTSELTKHYNDLVRFKSMSQSPILDAEITHIANSIKDINHQIDLANQEAWTNISNSNFFIKRIQITANYPWSFMITVIILALFFTPIALIYSISGKSKYYNLKKKNDKTLVINNYLDFKRRYTLLFEKKIGIPNIQFYEPFIDPPFNTAKKPVPSYSSQEEFFNHVLS